MGCPKRNKNQKQILNKNFDCSLKKPLNYMGRWQQKPYNKLGTWFWRKKVCYDFPAKIEGLPLYIYIYLYAWQGQGFQYLFLDLFLILIRYAISANPNPVIFLQLSEVHVNWVSGFYFALIFFPIRGLLLTHSEKPVFL